MDNRLEGLLMSSTSRIERTVYLRSLLCVSHPPPHHFLVAIHVRLRHKIINHHLLQGTSQESAYCYHLYVRCLLRARAYIYHCTRSKGQGVRKAALCHALGVGGGWEVAAFRLLRR